MSNLLLWLRPVGPRSFLYLLFLLATALPLHAQNQTAAAPPEVPPETFRGEKIFLRDFGGDEVGYLSIPLTAPAIGVVIAPDSHGLDASAQRFCDALAEAGFLALAVDLANGRTATTPEEAAAIQATIDPAVAAKALEAGLLFYEKSPRFRMERVALVALGASDDAALRLARSKKGRMLAAISLIDPAGSPGESGLRARIQRIQSTSPAQNWTTHIPALTAFWASDNTRKNWFERLIE